MSFSQTLAQSIRAGGRDVAQNNTYEADAESSVDVSIPDSETDMLVNFALDVSQIEVIYIKSDRDLTLETNSGAAPDDTLNLVADVPYIWTKDSYFTNKLTVDITALYATNASAAAAQLQIEVLHDATP